MSTVTIEIVDRHVILIAPFSADLPSAARRIGGRWEPAQKRWRFAATDIDRVRDLARRVYGTDGSVDEAIDTVTVRHDCSDYAFDQEVVVAGRTIATRRYRDEDIRLADGVVVVQGGFSSSGGSMRNPRIGENNAVIEIRDLPRSAAERFGLEIVDEVADARTRLTDERERLTARMAEIDAELACLDEPAA